MIREKRVSTAQLFAIVMILGTALKMMMLPVLLLKSSGRDSVIGLSVILAFELVCLGAAVAAIVLAPDKSFPELLESLVGKAGVKIIFSVLALFFLSKLILTSGEVRIFFSENLFAEFPWPVYAIPFFALCIMFGKGTARAIGRTCQFLLAFIVVATLVMLVLIGRGVDFEEILPLGRFGASFIATDMLKFSMWYGDYAVLAVFLGSVKRTRHTALLTMISGVLSSLVVLSFTLGLTASFANLCSLIRFGQNVTGMSHYALGNLLEARLDLMVFCVWMLGIFLKAGIFAYAVVYCVRVAVPSNTIWPALISGAAMYIISVCIPSATGLHSFMSQIMAWPALILQIVVPALMLVAVLAHRGKENKKKDANKTDSGEKNDAE